MMDKKQLSDRQKKLIFRSWHRGTREMDLIMGGFADSHVPAFDDAQLQEYEDLLGENDPDLYNWFSGRETIPDHVNSAVMQLFLNYDRAA